MVSEAEVVIEVEATPEDVDGLPTASPAPASLAAKPVQKLLIENADGGVRASS